MDMDETAVAKVYEELSNPVLMFISENCIIEKDGWVFKYDFEERLNNWLRNNHFPIYTKGEINQIMRDFYNESQREAFNGGKPYRVWAGLRWRTQEDRAETFHNQSNHFTGIYKRNHTMQKCFIDPCKSVKSGSEIL
jgi:hypothetical protein